MDSSVWNLGLVRSPYVASVQSAVCLFIDRRDKEALCVIDVCRNVCDSMKTF